MATRKKVVDEKLVILDPDTGEVKDLPADVLHNRKDLHVQLAEEAESKRKFLGRARDRMVEGMSFNLGFLLMGAGLLAIGATLGMFGQPIYEKHTQAASLYKAMQTSIPVVNALEVAVDPGKFVNKLTDVIMTPTRGGVFKSGKGLYIQESEGSVSLTIFESAFITFQQAYGVDQPDQIVSHLIGKVIKARGTVQSRPQKDGSSRTSMVVYAPGLIQIIPERP